MIRTANIRVFEDTMRACSAHPLLKAAIESSISNQLVIPQAQALAALPAGRREGRIIVSKKRSFEAASGHPGKRVCVLNFASSVNPGGGVASGSSAQEESLCRCSTLYPCLRSDAPMKLFYAPHRLCVNPLHTGDCIYTPDVVVFKSDTDHPRMLSDDQWYRVNTITCAAPDLRTLHGLGGKISAEELYALHRDRMNRILHIAARTGNEAVILGAFGCGVFGNDPEIVAPALNEAAQAWRNHFDVIEFAVFCRTEDDTNFRIFSKHIQP